MIIRTFDITKMLQCIFLRLRADALCVTNQTDYFRISADSRDKI